MKTSFFEQGRRFSYFVLSMRNFILFSMALLLLGARMAFAECTLTETSSAGFSSTASGSSQLASLSVTCDSEYRIGLDAGVWSSGIRRLHDGKGSYISYRLWQDSAASASPSEYSDTVRVILSWPPYGSENQQSANLSLSLHVNESCRLDVSGIHGFGTWPTGGTDPSGVALGSISVTCSPSIRYALGIDAGQNMSRSTCKAGGDRKTGSVRNCHDPAPFAAFCPTDRIAPFFAAVNECLSEINAATLLQIRR